ncbi:LuxR C-terminal-related transcriptional regulator [Mycolicibacterium neworleansense]|uniref:Response regulator containing a CheY-like receiver domain and an HTH DNA-binding domain protein n=1 Tax=Mycolicibacterium neworleansense TaxID=146018 RepID=A0A0H5RSA1_9MYCO|nr:LuxR family transcriptional regulator [Mycolicibacterium neworleansense]MCV7361688.1 helix-turn-helix domain-containing protein [Mycolicibacterium neworleansense]CRZ17045.1 response regulator containing a CheY-like receiver domain and an HTH DNA-binding domain protein [Mycolicibacterium neworleansense]
MKLAGRDEELATIRRSLGGPGTHHGVLIVGSAGVGKTRLAREALSHASASGHRTSWFVGTESARAIPLGAFTGSITQSMCDPLPDVRRVIDSFVAQQRMGKVVIGIDDAHLLDPLSAHVVHQLAQTQGVRLVVTARSGGPEPDAVTALWKDSLLDRIDLEPLSATAAAALVESAVAGPVDSRSTRRFWKLTGGNALYLLQLVKDQIAAGRMHKSAGVWMWDGDVAVSQSITDMVGRRLGELSPGMALVLDTLSQCEPLSVDILGDLVDRADLEAAEEMHLVTVERAGRDLMATLAHPLYGELRRATAGEMHLSSIRGKLARRLAAEPDGDMRATVRRALLALHSDLPPDPELYLTAARCAAVLLDPDAADRFAAAAAACGAPDAAPMRAMTLVLLSRGDEAEAVLRDISTDGRPDRHHWATVRAANLAWMLGRPCDAGVILENLSGTTESDAQQMERRAIQACVEAILGCCASAEEKAGAALDSGGLSDFHAMMASIALVMALGALGHADDINAVAEQAIERANTSFESSPMRFWFGAVHARACRLTGRIDAMTAMAARLEESARDVPGVAYANLAYLLGHAELVRADLGAAVKHLHEAYAGAETHAITTGLRVASCFSLAEAHAKLGHATAAEEALARAAERVPDDYVFMHTAMSVAKGWTLAAGGALTDAVELVRAAGRAAAQREQPTHELQCLQTAAQWGDTAGLARSRELADTLRLPLAQTVARHIEALVADDGDQLLAVAAEYRAIGDRATATDATAQAAVAFGRHGQGKRSAYAAALAQEGADECGGLCTPALRNPAGQPLTGRQREIVELVVAGLSNKQIAERLVMSVRSVEGHLYRACQRVGASSREQLAAIIRRGPTGPA